MIRATRRRLQKRCCSLPRVQLSSAAVQFLFTLPCLVTFPLRQSFFMNFLFVPALGQSGVLTPPALWLVTGTLPGEPTEFLKVTLILPGALCRLGTSPLLCKTSKSIRLYLAGAASTESSDKTVPFLKLPLPLPCLSLRPTTKELCISCEPP